MVIITLDRWGRSTQNVLAFADQLRRGVAGAETRWGDIDTRTPMGSMVVTVMTACARMELGIGRERIIDAVAKGPAAGKGLGGRRPTFTVSRVRSAPRLIEEEETATEAGRGLEMSRAGWCRRIRDMPIPIF